MTRIACLHDAMAVVHAVSNPAAAARVMAEHLGFQRVDEARGEVVTNGALTVRLRPRQVDEAAASLVLDLVTSDVAATVAYLQTTGQVLRVGAQRWDRGHRLEQIVSFRHGLELVVVKELTEDDLDQLPKLPATFPWEPTADLLVREVLRTVPLVFRPAARKRVTRKAEALARKDERSRVDVTLAVRALLLATPSFQHATLQAELSKRGIGLDPGEERAADRHEALPN